ncbi:MAG: SDR family NAD(P)-dependent oxidoreductase [SAR324 cluster bacterium]|nr:SDR family NAD(P)-dependent oxidoreductase [SAR324 cluster bacterium]
MSIARIFITGASSGIGATLARFYANQYRDGLHLGLLARRAGRLVSLAASLRELGAVVETYSTDVRDGESMQEIVRDFTGSAGGVDLVIANAGISPGEKTGKGDLEPAANVIATNLLGVFNTLVPMIPTMIEQKSGHLVAVGSVAGFFGMPGKGAYCGTKAAVKILMDSYRPVLKAHGIQVTTICPGFVESEMTANNSFPMPFIVKGPKAAKLIARAIAKGRKTYVFPWQMRLVIPLLHAMPEWVLARMVSRP